MHRSVLRGNNKLNASFQLLRSFLRAIQFVQRFAFGSVRFLAAVVGKCFGRAVSFSAARAHNKCKQSLHFVSLGLSNASAFASPCCKRYALRRNQ